MGLYFKHSVIEFGYIIQTKISHWAHCKSDTSGGLTWCADLPNLITVKHFYSAAYRAIKKNRQKKTKNTEQNFIRHKLYNYFLVYPNDLDKTKQYWSHVHLIFMLVHEMLNTSWINFRKRGYILIEITMLYNDTKVILIVQFRIQKVTE